MRPLHVCLDARLVSGLAGGVEQAIAGLASGLSALKDGEEEYLFLVHPDADDWIRPLMRGSCRLLPCRPAPILSPSFKERLKAVLPLAARVWSGLRRLTVGYPVRPKESDGTIERAGVDVMHFTTQQGFLTVTPSLYQPWDLQHLHYPEYFHPATRAAREGHYRTLCAQAARVCIATQWGKRDLLRLYGLPVSKIAVIPVAAPLATYAAPSVEEIAAVRSRLALREDFVLYPAQTWPHKNHLGLLECLARLRDRQGLRIPVACTGRLTEHFPAIQKSATRLGLRDQVRFLGFVPPADLACLYRLARCLVFPSLFEGWGMPVSEAQVAGLPVACSRATSLPEVAGEACLYFDPHRPEELAEVLQRLWTDGTLRAELVARGRAHVARFTWEKTAKLFRAHYRQIAGRTLGEEDQALVASSQGETPTQ